MALTADSTQVLDETASRADTLPAAVRLDPAELRALLRSYYRDVPAEDLAPQRPRDLLGAALSHRVTAGRRTPGHPLVRAFTPTVEEDGWATGLSVVEVVTDDSPFLVDSITAELDRQGHAVRLLVHPQPLVRRDDEGGLQAVDVEGEGTLRESWMHVQVDPLDAPQHDAVVAGLRRVLGDVRAAVADWGPMEARARDISAGLGAVPPAGVPAPDVDQARRLLDWLAEGQFVFLGYQEYDFIATDRPDEAYLEPRPETGLGLLREGGRGRRVLSGAPARKAAEPRLLIVTKANSRATVHRPDYLDYISVKTFDDAGRVTGEQRFLGLFIPHAYGASVTEVPYVSDKVEQIRAAAGYAPDGFLDKDLLRALENYPRDELLQAGVEELTEVATAVVHLRRRPRTRLFVRTDYYERFVACLVYLEHDHYTLAVRDRVSELLREAFGGIAAEPGTHVSNSPVAQLYVVVHLERGTPPPEVDLSRLEAEVVAATRTWEEEVADTVPQHPDGAAGLASRLTFPEGYKEDFTPRQAADDLTYLAGLSGEEIALNLYLPDGAPPEGRRLKLYRRGEVSLFAVLPAFQGLGVEVLDQRPHNLTDRDGQVWHVSDFGLQLTSGRLWQIVDPEFRDRFQEAFHAVWQGRAEDDGFNSLVLLAGLSWRQVVVLRALAAYLRQTGSVFSRGYVERALRENPELARLLVELFEVRFSPDDDDAGRQEREQRLTGRVLAAVDDVASLDHDRIVRALLAVLAATLRTNYYRGADVLAWKIDPQQLPDLPAPRPTYELWVHGPHVEGVHLRFGRIARGGLRWSDRREDFRTEVLGLVKAQVVKNAVIVPAGAKGGFVAKQLPDPAVDRAAWLDAGRRAYRSFISALLDVTDNIVDGEVVPPERVVRHDGDDPYLVVAADKGTAAFSDLANAVAREHGFWLDDAFASGGSSGYDHKKMGITARGAWEAVRRHFRELGHDTQRADLTVVGIGDMSGDVFGNGMLLSRHIRLVAAFDHRHVFLDPDPDAAASYDERRRLFDSPQSSWADYDPDLISEGGGVHPRTAKSVPVTAQARARLGLADDVTELAPNELVRAVLTAPVDLLWNGGIGTYVKAATESHAQIGDRANDAVRVDGGELRCRVVGEGGNLGVSQLGRVEAAQRGVRLNTDAIDNSAGVDSSDHEVNIKVLLSGPVRDGRLSHEERDELLAAMTDDVAERVLRQNYEQSVLLGNARTLQPLMLGAHQRFMRWLEERGELDRQLEFLPDDSELARRGERGQGLTSPEFAVLVAYAKLALKTDLIASDVPDDPWFAGELQEYFPQVLRREFAEDLRRHRLRREIIATRLANSVVNRGGITFSYRVTEETGADAARTTRAFVISREVFGLAGFVRDVEQLDNRVDTDVQSELYLEFRRLLDRAVRWFLGARPGELDVGSEIDRFAPAVGRLIPQVGELLRGRAREDAAARAEELVAGDVPQGLAATAATLVDQFSLLDVVELADRTGRPLDRVARARFVVEDHVGIDRLLGRVRDLPREERWDSLARGALREDLHAVLNDLTAAVLEAAADDPLDASLAAWDKANPVMPRVRELIAELEEKDEVSLAALSVTLRTLRAAVG